MTRMTIGVERKNFEDQFRMTMQVCSIMLRLSRDGQLTSREFGVVEDLIKLMRVQVAFYSTVGLPIERDPWEVMKKQMHEYGLYFDNQSQ